MGRRGEYAGIAFCPGSDRLGFARPGSDSPGTPTWTTQSPWTDVDVWSLEFISEIRQPSFPETPLPLPPPEPAFPTHLMNYNFLKLWAANGHHGGDQREVPINRKQYERTHAQEYRERYFLKLWDRNHSPKDRPPTLISR